MTIATPIAGAYTSTFNRQNVGANAMGYTKQGFNLSFTQKGKRVEESDLYGMSLVAIIGRGCQATLDATFKIWSSTLLGSMFRWSTTGALGSVYGVANPIGAVAGSNSAPDVIILTAVANTPAAVAAAPATLTANVVVSPDNNMQLIFNSDERDVPIKFDLLLNDASGVGTLCTVT